MTHRNRRSGRPDAPAPRFLSLFCAATVVLVGLMSFGTYINDEAAQLQGLHNLVRGSLEMEERPRQFYAPFEGAFLPGVNESAGQNEFVSLTAVPAYGLLWATSHVVAPHTLLLLGWAGAAYVTTTRGVSRLHEARTGRPWAWSEPVEERGVGARLRAMKASHWSVLGVLAFWTFTQWAQTRPVDFGTWGETFAVETTHVLLSALGAALFFGVAHRETGSLRAASLAMLALLLGPYTGWGFGIKYHAPSAVLAIVTLWAYQRDDRWRYAAFAAAVLGALLTPLGAALLAALVLVEAVRAAREARRGRPGTLRRLVVALAVGAGVVLAYNLAVLGDWRGVLAPALDAMDPWAALLERLRYEGWRRSLHNVWGVFVHGASIQGEPVAVWALSPLAALAVLAPLRLRGAWTRTTALAAAACVVFVLLFVHAAHTQGDGRDNRFFLSVLPAMLLLGAVVAAPRLDALELARHRPGRRLAWMVAAVFLLLVVLGAAGVELDPGAPTRQMLAATWLFGTAAWLGLLALEGLHGVWARRGEDAVPRAWAWAAPAMLVPGLTWLVHVIILTNRVIPPWPFGSDNAGISFLMPTLDDLRTWWLGVVLP